VVSESYASTNLPEGDFRMTNAPVTTFAYLIVSRESSGILWQDLLHGITHGDFGLRG
jgi:hypothetical protein